MMNFVRLILSAFFFFFNDTATTEIYTLSLHDALPISLSLDSWNRRTMSATADRLESTSTRNGRRRRSEEHTSELQSQSNLVCRLLLEKKKKRYKDYATLSHLSILQEAINRVLTECL